MYRQYNSVYAKKLGGGRYCDIVWVCRSGRGHVFVLSLRRRQ